jgi:thiosulfate reductase cytochrome b subunit
MHKLYINPLPVRIWHWTNAFGFVLLIASGVQIRYLDLFQWVNFRTAVVAHNWIGFVLIANFFIWLGFYLFSDKIKVYHPELSPTKYFKASFRQMQFYGYGIFKGDPNPHHPNAYRKFNALQSMMYQIIMMMLVPLQFFTGVLLFIVFSGFIIVHVYLASLGHTPTAHFKAMITGYEEIEEEPAKEAAAKDAVA